MFDTLLIMRVVPAAGNAAFPFSRKKFCAKEMEDKMKTENIVLPEALVSGLTKIDPRVSSSGIRTWDNYFATNFFECKVPVVFKFRIGHTPSSETPYDVVYHWVKGAMAWDEIPRFRGETPRSTVDHWEIKFFAHPENNPDGQLHIISLEEGEDVMFGPDARIESPIQFRGIGKSSLIFFTPIGVEPDYQVVRVETQLVSEDLVLVQIPRESWRKIPGAYRADTSDDNGGTIAVYDKRRERRQPVAIAQKIRKDVEDGEKSYEYITLRDLTDEVKFALTENGLVPLSDSE